MHSFNKYIRHIIFICLFATLFAKGADGAPIGGLIFLNSLLLFIGILYGLFIAKHNLKQLIKDELEDKNNK